jgi:hypothetical protein
MVGVYAEPRWSAMQRERQGHSHEGHGDTH